MKFFRRNPKHELHPIPQEILDAHQEAIEAKREVRERAPFFRELAENMTHRHKLNGFGEKLEATYAKKGWL